MSALTMHTVISHLGQVDEQPADGSFMRVLPHQPSIHEFSKVPSSRVFDSSDGPRCGEPGSEGQSSLQCSRQAHSGALHLENETQFDPVTGRPSWHTDQSFRSPALAGSAMYCLSTPRDGSGATLFSGTTAAYKALNESTKKWIGDLSAVHSFQTLHKNFKKYTGSQEPQKEILSKDREQQLHPVAHPLVFVQPITSKKSLYLAPHVIQSIDGLGPEEGQRLIDELAIHATQPHFIWRHEWNPGDLVIWDNRRTMHAATRVQEEVAHERVMWRATFHAVK
eukprot:gnl/MRDRNA2_/MRDRNA2_17197_c0_seq1.p1 gnl/MRDRNA2_/MRDRNA2_17197_c0~~gnl/MRDRNA2_/MRDRNA2_17197_c0_seq1.p1  ORF type:complete len:300 (+),score=33.96 gnl/MRDRNA2_/MRDRNA2_17197_c0_seq1:63-902(+)